MTCPTPSRQEKERARRDTKRERDVLLLYGAAFRNIAHIDDAKDHVPRASSDSTLTALCQLTAIRLGCQRALITLIDEYRQHILAEATCDLSLRPEAPGNASSVLWLGNVSIPRKWGPGEALVAMGEEPILVVKDLAEDSRFRHRNAVQAFKDMRFYASAALVSPGGAVVGTLCVFDAEPRDDLTKEEKQLFKSLAETVVDYLNTYTIKDQFQRGERFTRGLVSFSEGASALLPFEENKGRDSSSMPSQLSPEPSSATERDVTSAEDATDTGLSSLTDATADMPNPSHNRPSSIALRTNHAKTARHRSIRTLQDSILPTNSKSMFSRAANVLMASSNLDGVLILDASVAANGSRRDQNHSESGNDAPSESYRSTTSSSDEHSPAGIEEKTRGTSSSTSKMCQVLGIATAGDGANTGHGTLLEPDLGRLFQQYPHGNIFTFTAEGLSLSSTEEGSGDMNIPEFLTPEGSTKRRYNGRPVRGSTAVREMFPEARSVAFVPFWDYERSRWFAGCLCWSNSPYRLLSASVDLTHFKIFSHLIMRELSRLDAMALGQSKTTFVASISHELRSPLHGILGTLEFIKDTPLDSFQTSMLNSLNACGTTLLDTINHVMDYAKLSEARKGISSRRLKNSNTIRLSSKPLKGRRTKDPAFDLAIATEEVVEAVFSGSSYVPVRANLLKTAYSPSEESYDPLSSRKVCFIVLDLEFEEDWVFSFPVGSWRRIVMNLFGNAVKYTQTGYIHVSLRASKSVESSTATTAVMLTITDSGSGMSPSFLANRAFQPFSQENSHSAGTGLGLSIVGQIINTNGGKIEVSSDQSVGTKFTVKLALNRPELPDIQTAERVQFLSFLPRMEARRICILHKELDSSSENKVASRTVDGLARFKNALAVTLEKHLKMKVIQTTEWQGHDADIVICPEVSFDYLRAIRRRRAKATKAPVTIFVAMDALEAAALRSDVRVTNRESVVEIMTQPCGPFKLAFILNRCLDRFAQPGENVEHPISTSVSPSPQPRPDGMLAPVEQPKSLDTLLASQSGEIAHETLSSIGTSSTNAQHGDDRPSSASDKEEADLPYILIADDNPLNRKLLVAFMKKRGLPYKEASNGLEALQAYQARRSNISVILMDMSMPVMDGMSATRAIRQHEQTHDMPRCSIIALTGLASASARLEAWSSGIDHFMTKPVNFKVLGDMVKKDEAKRQERRKSVDSIKEANDPVAQTNTVT